LPTVSSDDDDEASPTPDEMKRLMSRRRTGVVSSVRSVAVPVPNRRILSRGANPLIVPETEAEAEAMLVTLRDIYDASSDDTTWNKMTPKPFHVHFGTDVSSADPGGDRKLSHQREIVSAILKLCKKRFGESGSQLVLLLEDLSNETSALIVEFLHPKHSPSWMEGCGAGELIDKGLNIGKTYDRQEVNMVGAVLPGTVPNDIYAWHPFAKALRAVYLEDGHSLRAGNTELLQHHVYHREGHAVTQEQVDQARKASGSLTKTGLSRSVNRQGETDEERIMREEKKDQRRAVPVAGRVDYTHVYVPFREQIDDVAAMRAAAAATPTPMTDAKLDSALHDVIVKANLIRGQHHLNEDDRSVVVDHSSGAVDDPRPPITANEILYQHSIEVRMKSAANKFKDALSEIFNKNGSSMFDDQDVLKAITLLSRINTREPRKGQNGAMNWFVKCLKDLLSMSNGDDDLTRSSSSSQYNVGGSSSAPVLKKHKGKSVDQIIVGARFQFYSMITARLMLYWLNRKDSFANANLLPNVLKSIELSEDMKPTKRDKFCDFLCVRRGDGGTAVNVMRARKSNAKSSAEETTTTTLCVVDGTGQNPTTPLISMWALDVTDSNYQVLAPFHDSEKTMLNMKRSCSILVRMIEHGSFPQELQKRMEGGVGTVSTPARVPIACDHYVNDRVAGTAIDSSDNDLTDITDPVFDCLWKTSTWFLPFGHVPVETIREDMIALHKKVDEAIHFYESSVARWDVFHPRWLHFFDFWSKSQMHSSEDNLYSYAFSSAASEMIKSETACQHSKETLRALFGDHPDTFRWIDRDENARRSHIDDLNNIKTMLNEFDAIVPSHGHFYPLVNLTINSVVDFFCTLKCVEDKHGEQLEVDFDALSSSVRSDNVIQERQNLTWTRARVSKFTTQPDTVNNTIAKVAHLGFVLGRNWANNATVKTIGFNMPCNVETKLKIGIGYTATTIGICNLRNAIRFTDSAEAHRAFIRGELDDDPECARAAMCVLHSRTDTTDRRIDLRSNLIDFAKRSVDNWVTLCMVAYVGRGVVANNRDVRVDTSAIVLDDRHMPVRLHQSGPVFFVIDTENTERFGSVYSTILENVERCYPTSSDWSFIDIKTADHFETLVVYHQNIMASNGPQAGFFTFPGVRERPNSEYLLKVNYTDRNRISADKQDWGRFDSVRIVIPTPKPPPPPQTVGTATTAPMVVVVDSSSSNRKSERAISFDDEDDDDEAEYAHLLVSRRRG